MKLLQCCEAGSQHPHRVTCSSLINLVCDSNGEFELNFLKLLANIITKGEEPPHHVTSLVEVASIVGRSKAINFHAKGKNDRLVTTPHIQSSDEQSDALTTTLPRQTHIILTTLTKKRRDEALKRRFKTVYIVSHSYHDNLRSLLPQHCFVSLTLPHGWRRRRWDWSGW